MARRTPSAPVPPTQGARADAAGVKAPAAEGDFTESYERMWSIILSLAIGAGLAAGAIWALWDLLVWILVKVFTS